MSLKNYQKKKKRKLRNELSKMRFNIYSEKWGSGAYYSDIIGRINEKRREENEM